VNRKKIKLEFSHDYDFLLLGISSSEKEHRLIWSINNHLNISLARTTDHKSYSKKASSETEFSCYVYNDDLRYLNYRIIANRSDQDYLLDEFKKIDFFMIINGEFEEDTAKDIRKKLVQLDTINAVFIINPEGVKSKDKLLFS
jgi:hypothetical protein